MDIYIAKTTYYPDWKDYNLEVAVKHNEKDCNVIFKINGKAVVQQNISNDETQGLTDADIIHTVEDKYIKERQSVDKYADIILNHSREMKIVKKHVTYTADSYGAKFIIEVEVKDKKYHFVLTNDKTKDTFACILAADDVSEVLEKFRIFLNAGLEISRSVADHLDVLVQQHPLIR